MVYYPSVTRLLPLATVKRERVLPVDGEVLVSEWKILETQDIEDLKKGMRTVWAVWISLFLSLFVYIGVSHIQQPGIPCISESDLPVELIKNGLFLSSLIIIIAIYYIKQSYVNKSCAQGLNTLN